MNVRIWYTGYSLDHTTRHKDPLFLHSLPLGTRMNGQGPSFTKSKIMKADQEATRPNDLKLTNPQHS